MAKGSSKARSIRADDVPQIVAIQESIRQRKVSRKWVQMVEGYLQKQDKVGFVALKEDRIVGFIIGEIKGEGFGLEQSGWINWTGVHPREMGLESARPWPENFSNSLRRRESWMFTLLSDGTPRICFPSLSRLDSTVQPSSILGNIWIEAFRLKGELPG